MEHAVAWSILLISVVALNIAFLCYCMYHFRNKLVSVKYFVLDMLSCGKTKNMEKSRRATQKRNSTHKNPLKYRATLVKEQVFQNPVHLREDIGEAMHENPLQSMKREKALVDAVWEKKVVEMRTMRAKSNADRRKKIRRIASFKLQAKRRKQQRNQEEVGEETGKWLKAVDPESGKEFYYNDKTREAVWELPEGYKDNLEDV